ncbi:MAG: hypothetical protein ACTSRE_03260 [Promethearchaeota archaeon]
MTNYCRICGKRLPESGDMKTCPGCYGVGRGRLRGIRRVGGGTKPTQMSGSGFAFIIIMALIALALLVLGGIT